MFFLQTRWDPPLSRLPSESHTPAWVRQNPPDLNQGNPNEFFDQNIYYFSTIEHTCCIFTFHKNFDIRANTCHCCIFFNMFPTF